VDFGLLLRVALGVLALWALIIVVLWFARPRDASLSELVRLVPDCLRLIRDLITDRSVPLDARAALAGLAIWIVSPIDFIPEFIPVLGPLDDVVVLVLVLRYVRRRIGDEVLKDRWPGTPTGYELLGRLLG
jgi:uncharacterized membrane protein YkvA (DUF1232 family)